MESIEQARSDAITGICGLNICDISPIGAVLTHGKIVLIPPPDKDTNVVATNFKLNKRSSSHEDNQFSKSSEDVGILAVAFVLLSPAIARGDEMKQCSEVPGALTFAPDGTLFVGDNISSEALNIRFRLSNWMTT